jgi:hypothetical protein
MQRKMAPEAGMQGGSAHGVVAVGDSWVTGYGLALAGVTCLSWGSWLAWSMASCLTQHAVNGSRAHQVARDQLPLLSAGEFQLGVAWVGANDVGDFQEGSFREAVEEICAGLRSAADVAAIATLPLSMRTPAVGWRAVELAVRDANRAVRQAADRTGVVVVELEDALNGPWAMAPDRQHPTSVGQLEAANVASRLLTALPLLRELPDPAARTPPKAEQQLYDVSPVERARAAISGIRQRRSDRALVGNRAR